jgi:hypothetical protein
MKNFNAEDPLPEDPLPNSADINAEDTQHEDPLPNNAGINSDKKILKAHLKWEEKVVARENGGESVKTYWKSKSRTTSL